MDANGGAANGFAAILPLFIPWNASEAEPKPFVGSIYSLSTERERERK